MTKDFMVGEVELSYSPLRIKTEKIACSKDIFRLMWQTYPEDKISLKEYLKVLLLNNHGDVLGWSTIGEGGITECSADIRHIFQTALLANATGIILCHNHPSGCLRPSKPDKKLTNDVAEAGGYLNIRLLDHIIINGNGEYYSFADNGEI